MGAEEEKGPLGTLLCVSIPVAYLVHSELDDEAWSLAGLCFRDLLLALFFCVGGFWLSNGDEHCVLFRFFRLVRDFFLSYRRAGLPFSLQFLFLFTYFRVILASSGMRKKYWKSMRKEYEPERKRQKEREGDRGR